LSCSIAARKFAASSIPRLLFPTLHDLCERDPTENEEAQHRQYDHAIRRHRKIVWQLHATRSGSMPACRFPPPWSVGS
jgi:hypothetical protein